MPKQQVNDIFGIFIMNMLLYASLEYDDIFYKKMKFPNYNRFIPV